MATIVSLRDVSRVFHTVVGKRPVWERLSLDIRRGELVSVFGPNGCGKTTLLNIIAGIDDEYEGVCERMPDMNVSYMYQHYRQSNFPWLTVLDNITLPLKMHGVSESKRRATAGAMLARLRLSLDLEAYPYQLSGGQHQLVALVRALITEPAVLLLDEPFSALDYETTLFFVGKLREIWRELGITIVCVSHDIETTLLLGQRILVLGKNPSRVVADLTGHRTIAQQLHAPYSDHYLETRNKVLGAFMPSVPLPGLAYA